MNSRTLRILLVDDDEDDYVLTRDLFGEIEGVRYKLDWVSTYEEGLEEIFRNQHDVYLVDYRLGARNGLELLREAIAGGCKAPIILLTGQGDREVDIEAMRSGAADFLIKMQTGAPLLERSIRYAIERRKTEEDIIVAEKRFRAVFEQSADAILLIDLGSRRIIDTNVALRDLLGYTQEELLKMTVHNLMDCAPDIVEGYIDTVINSHYHFLEEVKLVRRQNDDSQTGHVLAEASLNLISYGNARAISIVARDLARFSGRLSQPRIQSETDTLKHALLSGITGEFRTPLTSILGITSLLERELPSPEKKSYARLVHNSAAGLLGMLNHVSCLLRCEELNPDMFEEVALARTVRGIAVPFEKKARARNVGFQINVRHDVLVRLDTDLFRQAVAAVLDNAVHFTTRGVVSVTIDTRQHDNGLQAILQVSDTGHGIASDMLSRIFDPFIRSFAEKSDTQEGRGLGLTIARHVTEALGGTIKVISTEGEGTTVLLTLPAEAPVEEPSMPRNTDHRMPGALPRMLVIEDDKGYQKLIMRHFDGIYQIDCADTAEQAISLCENHAYSLILVDINLGYGRSGLDALSDIRLLSGYADIPAIAVTAYSFELKRKELFEAGFTDYVQKPFTQSQILGVVSRHITRRTVSTEYSEEHKSE